MNLYEPLSLLNGKDPDIDEKSSPDMRSSRGKAKQIDIETRPGIEFDGEDES